MTRTEPTAVITSIRNRDTSQMRTNAQDDDKFRINDTFRIVFLIAELRQWHGFFASNFFGRSTSDKDWFATPLDRHGFAHFQMLQFKFRKGQGQNFGRCTHGCDEFDHQETCGRGIGKSHRRQHQIGKSPTFWFGNLVNTVIFIAVI